ncbi:MAG: hypothetical protein Q9164_006992, partial [Protoblastenia rupestris]
MTQGGREEQTLQEGCGSMQQSSRDTSPSMQNASGSASDNDTGERPVREKFKKASLVSMSGKSSQATLEQPLQETRLHGAKTTTPVAASEVEPTGTGRSRGRPIKKRSLDDLDSTGKFHATLPEVAASHTNGHARKRSRDVRAGVPLRVDDKMSVTSPLDEKDRESAGVSDLNFVNRHVPLESDMAKPEMMETIAPIEEQAEGNANGNPIIKPLEGGAEPEGEAPTAMQSADAPQEKREGAASPTKKRSRDQLDTELDREQKIAATEELRAQRLSSELDRSQVTAYGEEITQTLETSDPNRGASKSVFGNAAAPLSRASSSSLALAPQITSQSAFAASGFAALANSSTSPFGTIGDVPAKNMCFHYTPVIHDNVSVPNHVASTTLDLPSVRDPSFSSNSKACAPDTGKVNPLPFAVAKSAKSSVFGGTISGGGFGGSSGSQHKLINFAAPRGDANLRGSNNSVRPIGLPEQHHEDDRNIDNQDVEAENVSKDDKSDEVDERFQHQDVETGEDGEESLFAARASLYSFRGTWKESGKGIFKFNVAANSPEVLQGSARTGRFIMRAHQTFRVLLNAPVFKGMKIGDSKGNEPSGKSFAFAVVEDGKPTPHMVK